VEALAAHASIGQHSMGEVLSATTERALPMTVIDQEEVPEFAAA
jgi:hypothetical protein